MWTVHNVCEPAQFWGLAGEIREGLAAWLGSGAGNLITGVFPGSLAARPINGMARLLQSIITLAPASSMLTHLDRVDPVELGHGLHVKSLAFIVADGASSSHRHCHQLWRTDGLAPAAR